MTLDMTGNQYGSLSYKINDIDCRKAYDVEKTSYRAAVTLYDANKSLTLLSYAYRNA